MIFIGIIKNAGLVTGGNSFLYIFLADYVYVGHFFAYVSHL